MSGFPCMRARTPGVKAPRPPPTYLSHGSASSCPKGAANGWVQKFRNIRRPHRNNLKINCQVNGKDVKDQTVFWDQSCTCSNKTTRAKFVRYNEFTKRCKKIVSSMETLIIIQKLYKKYGFVLGTCTTIWPF